MRSATVSSTPFTRTSAREGFEALRPGSRRRLPPLPTRRRRQASAGPSPEVLPGPGYGTGVQRCHHHAVQQQAQCGHLLHRARATDQPLPGALERGTLTRIETRKRVDRAKGLLIAGVRAARRGAARGARPTP